MCGCQRQPGSTTDVVARLRFLWSGVKGDVCFQEQGRRIDCKTFLNRHDSRSHAFSVSTSSKGSAGSHQFFLPKVSGLWCGNAHPAYLVLMRAQLHHEAAQIGLVLAHYSSHVERTDVLNDLLDKAQSELDDTRHAVSNAAHNFATLKQSLEDQLAQDNKALDKAKAESLAAEKGDLAEA